METLCLDSDILIDIIRGQADAVLQIGGAAILATTAINAFELWQGAHKGGASETRAVEELLSRLLILPFSAEAARLAGKIKGELDRSGKGIEFRDVFIGAIALHAGYPLKTRNKSHFQRIAGLELV